MQKSRIIRTPSFISSAVLSFIMLIGTAPTATAQIGGPKDIKPPNTVSQRFEKEGIIVDFSMKATAGADGKEQGLVAGADAVLQFSVKDKRTGQPITGLNPKGWISARSERPRAE